MVVGGGEGGQHRLLHHVGARLPGHLPIQGDAVDAVDAVGAVAVDAVDAVEAIDGEETELMGVRFFGGRVAGSVLPSAVE